MPSVLVPVKVRLGGNVDPSKVSAHTRATIARLAAETGNTSPLISSAWRPPAEQVRVMFDKAMAPKGPDGLTGLQRGRRLYKAAARVYDEFERCRRAGASRNATIAAMTKAIEEIGPGKISHHSADPEVLGVVDVDPASLERPAEYRAHAEKDPAVSKFIGPPNDPAFHHEIPAPSPSEQWVREAEETTERVAESG